MDSDQFRKAGKEMIDFIADYMENTHLQPPVPDIKPGLLLMTLIVHRQALSHAPTVIYTQVS